jgi:hypothetical protein
MAAVGSAPTVPRVAKHEIERESSYNFVVPSKAPWPEACWGMKLGQTVSNIRASEDFVKDEPERRAWLDSLGFVWDGRGRAPHSPSTLARGLGMERED